MIDVLELASTSKHTPLPWKIVEREIMEDGSVYPKHIVGGITEMQIALIESPAAAELFVNDPDWKHLRDSEMSCANARLIAAAPELLEALKECLRCGDGYANCEESYLPPSVRDKARAAITKATGDQA